MWIETALRVYLDAAVAGLVLVQALHFATPLMPYKFYCRNWDFGYPATTTALAARGSSACFWPGHGCGMTGCAPDWGRAGPLAIFTYKVPGPRGVWRHGGAVCAVLCQKFLPRLFDSKIFYGLALALPVALAMFSLAGYVYNPRVAL